MLVFWMKKVTTPEFKPFTLALAVCWPLSRPVKVAEVPLTV